LASPYERVLEALDNAGLDGTDTYKGTWMYQCPSHEDNKASLSIGEGDDGRALVYCFAGCKTQDIIDELGLSWGEMFSTSRSSATSRRGSRSNTGLRRRRASSVSGAGSGDSTAFAASPTSFPNY
jgi:hypothetical protein